MGKSRMETNVSTISAFTRQSYTSKTGDKPNKAGYSSILKRFSDSTSAHGIPHIISAKNTFVKLCWFFVTFGAFVVLVVQEYGLLKDYFGHPYTTKIDLITRTNLTFPAVTVCNMNRMRRSALVGTRFEGLLEVDGGTSGNDADYSWWFSWEFDSEISDGNSWNSGVSNQADDSAETTSAHQAEDASTLDANTESIGYASSQGSGVTVGLSDLSTGLTSKQQSHISGISSGGIDVTTTLDDSVPSTPATSQEVMSEAITSTDGASVDESVQERRKRWARDTVIRRIRDTSYSSSSSSFERLNDFDWLDDYDFDNDDFDYDDVYGWSGITDENDWQGFYEKSKSEDFSDILDVANPTKEELKNYGHQPEDFILQCTFDKRSCNYTDFHMFQNRHYGNCFTYNHGMNNSIVRSTSKSGAQFGLQLTLFVEQPEYVGLFSHVSGVRVSIHEASEAVFPEDQGIVAPTGMATAIGIKQSSIVRLPLPYGNCTNGKDVRFNSQNAQYSQQLCIRSCIQEELLNKCGCVTDIGLEEQTLCSYVNSTQQWCRQVVDSLYQDDQLNCDCTVACSDTDYVTSPSNAVWPSERYEEHLSSRLSAKNEKAARLLQDVETTRLNLVRLEIYYQELNFQSAEQIPTYTISSILGAFGGLLGLYIGISVITIAEFIVLLLQSIMFFIKRAFCVNKISP